MRALRTVHEGGTVVDPVVAARIADSISGRALTEREIDVLRWTADGKTSAEIAEIMCISERTVNFHVNNVVAKLGACNKTSAAVRAASRCTKRRPWRTAG